MNSSRLAAAGALLLVNTLCWGATDLKDIVPLIEKSASSEPDITVDEMEAGRQIHDRGPAAIPYLLPLLKHENRGVRKLTSHILCNMRDFGEEHLDALLESKRAGNELISPAIARIGTPRAIAFLVDELKKEKRTDTALTWAFYILGEKGVPDLVKLIESGPFDDKLVETIVYVFDRWKDKGEAAVDPLTEFISARRGDEKAMKCALMVLGKIGPKAQRSVPVLLKLAQDNPGSYRDAVDRALLAMDAPEAIAGVLRQYGERLDAGPSSSLDRLMHRAELLVDPLMEFISGKHGNEEAMRRAVTILGSIGPKAQRSVPVLLKLAEDNPGSYRDAVDDALLFMHAPEAMPGILRRLKEKPESAPFVAIARLEEAGRAAGPALVRCLEHDNWGVRIGAARAIGYIRYTEAGPDLIKLLRENDDWRQVFVSIQSLGRLRVAEAIGPLTKLSEDHWYPLVRDAAKQAVRVINGETTYESEIDESRIDFQFQFEVWDLMCIMPPDAPSSAGDKQQDGSRSHVNQTDSLDKVGIKVSDGYLVGSDQGKFGGELLFIDLTGKQTVLLPVKPQGICRMTSGIVAVTGVCHLEINVGMLFGVSKMTDGTWQARRWKALPGAPRTSSMLANGNLWVNCENGCVEISPAGDIKMVISK